jgi:hypothetical protein
LHSSRPPLPERPSIDDLREGEDPANRPETPIISVSREIAGVEEPRLEALQDGIPDAYPPRYPNLERPSVDGIRRGGGPANRPETPIISVSREIAGVVHADQGVPHKTDTIALATVANRRGFFTKREVENAQIARDFQERMCFPTDERMKRIVTGGTDFPFTIADIDAATFIWGPSASAVRGKEVHRKKLVGGPVERPMAQRQNVSIEMDIMKVEDVSFLLGVMDNGYILTSDLDRTWQEGAPNKSAKVLLVSIKAMVNSLTSRGFTVTTIYWDREAAITPIKSSLEAMGISVQQSAPGGHAGRAERAGRTIKNGVRSMVAHLPWIVCRFLLVLLVHWVCRSQNFQVHSQSMSNISPRQAVLGMIPNGRTDFRATFGDVVLAQLRETTNSVTTMRARDGIVVGAMDNKEGSMLFLNPLSGKTFVADHFKIIPTPDTTIAYLNSLALKEGKSVKTIISVLDGPAGVSRVEEEQEMPPGFFIPATVVEEGVGGLLQRAQHHVIEPLRLHQPELPVHSLLDIMPVNAPLTTPARPPPLETTSVDVFRSGGGTAARPSAPILSVVREAVSGGVSEVLPGGLNLLDKFRGTAVEPRDGVSGAPMDLAMTITVKKALQKYEGLATEVIVEELSQMLTKKVWHPVSRGNLTPQQRKAIIRSSMFVKEKVKPDGVFDKLRARIVAGGDQQDKQLYGDLSAPTVSTTSFYSVIGIAAAEGRQVLSLDVGKAYLNADMVGKEVHMKIDELLSAMLVKLDPTYAPFLDEKRELTVKLDKALYGCVQSANLWYKHIIETLTRGGFVPNQYDLCVLNRTNLQGTQCTLAIHVDDIFASSACPIMLAEFVTLIKDRYKEYTVQNGPVLGHLGMTIDFSVAGEVTATMQGCVDTLLKKSGFVGTAVTPATANLFNVREVSASGNRLATLLEFKQDRSLLALCLYMSKRTWPELLTAVSFLTTRINVWDTDDSGKLDRMVGYVRYAGNRGLRFKMGSEFTVRAWVDAAYGVHSDGKSQTGSAVTVGIFGTVHAKSVKQKIVTKSSTEAELVAASDSANQGFFVRNFIRAQGYNIGPLVIYQDNMSCMALLAAGRSSSERTRHIAIRYFWLKERVDSGEAIIEHKDGAELFANALTKPLQGPQFVREVKGLTNW